MKYVATLSGALLLLALPAYAQFSVPGAQNALSITLSPQNPAPSQSVTATVQSSFVDLDSAAIVWTADGKTIGQGVGQKSVTLVAPALGKETELAVDVAGGQESTSITIAPTSVDLLWEAVTYAPPFYRGRSLPSSGAPVRVTALPHFITASGRSLSPSDLLYTWRKDGQVLGDQSGQGRSGAVVDGPTLFGTETISVEVQSADGTLAGSASLRLSDQKPALLLYEDHPLFGVLYGQALGSSTFIPQSEMTFAAAPYFAPARSSTDAPLEYSWSVNSVSVQSPSTHADELTINAASSSGLALINLALTHASNFFFSADGAWQITLNNSSSFGASNPFQ